MASSPDQGTSVRLEQVMPLIQERLAAGGTVRFTPRGISMRPMLEGGRDQVELAPLPERLGKYDLPLYRRDSGQYVLHRIVAVGEGGYTCMGDNQFDPEYPLRPDQMIGVVTAFVRDGKAHSVHSLSHRFYCRLWHWSRPLRRLYLRVRGRLGRLKARFTKTR